MAVAIDDLLSIACFRQLAPTTLKRVAQVAERAAYRPRQAIFKQSDAPTGLYGLMSGRAKLYRQSRNRVQILAIPMPGECFGAETLPSDSPSSCTAEAITEVSTIIIQPDILQHLQMESSDFQEFLLCQIAFRLKQFVSLVHDLAFRDVTSRLAMVLVTRAAAEGKLTDQGICLDPLLSQQEFASMVGTAREVVNRVFRKFESDGLVRFGPRMICILNLEELNALARQETH